MTKIYQLRGCRLAAKFKKGIARMLKLQSCAFCKAAKVVPGKARSAERRNKGKVFLSSILGEGDSSHRTGDRAKGPERSWRVSGEGRGSERASGQRAARRSSDSNITPADIPGVKNVTPVDLRRKNAAAEQLIQMRITRARKNVCKPRD